MKFKEFWKRFLTLNRHHAEGFTLVELIVVIAILAILGAVAVPAYNGYIKKANMTADQTLVSEVAHALQLQYYTQGLNGAAVVVLGTDKTDASEGFARDAMAAAFGEGWTTVALKYDNWGNGGTVAKNALEHFSATAGTTSPLGGVYDGTISPSFADEVDDLFVLVRDTSMTVGEKLNKSGAELVQGAAGITSQTDISEFANNWAAGPWDNSLLMGGNEYNENAGSMDTDTLQHAIANAAVLKARNTALASYMVEQEGIPASVYTVLAEWNIGESKVPGDAVGALMNPSSPENELLWKKLQTCFPEGDTEGQNKVMSAISTYYGMGEDGNPLGDSSSTQAYKDGLAYLAMMDAVKNVNADQSTDETYWDDLAGAVSLYGSIARGEVSLDDLKKVYTGFDVGENSVVVLITAKGTSMAIQVNPLTASAQ